MNKRFLGALIIIFSVGFVYFLADRQDIKSGFLEKNFKTKPKTIDELKYDAAKTWSNYINFRAYGGIAAIEELDKIVANGYLVGNQENVNQTIALIRSSISNEEKHRLLRVLGVLFLNSNDAGVRNEISRYLVETILHSTESSVIKEATLVFTRLGFFPETLQVLDHALAEGHITSNDYYGEMAHILPAAPSDIQPKLIDNIASSGNEFARDVLASILSDRATTARLPPETLKSAASFMEKSEPVLPHQQDDFGGIQAINWQNWLASSVGINSQLSGVSDEASLSKILKIDDIDPRKLVIAFWTEPSAQNMQKAFDEKTLSKAADIISKYGAANSQDLGIQEYTNTALNNIRSSKK